MKLKSRKEENAERTRAALVAAARSLFAKHGYAGAGTEDIVRSARVTRGALYHHFRDKKALFDAIVENEEARLSKTIASAAKAQPDAWRGLEAGCLAFLDACRDPAIRQIVVVDGPNVLGAERERSLADRFYLRGISNSLNQAVLDGVIEPLPVNATAQALFGALVAAAQYVGAQTDEPSRHEEARVAVRRLLEGLKREEPSAAPD
jgi:AcrR family transcriptional regulator